jgi:hypothetical protein
MTRVSLVMGHMVLVHSPEYLGAQVLLVYAKSLTLATFTVIPHTIVSESYKIHILRNRSKDLNAGSKTIQMPEPTMVTKLPWRPVDNPKTARPRMLDVCPNIDLPPEPPESWLQITCSLLNARGFHLPAAALQGQTSID